MPQGFSVARYSKWRTRGMSKARQPPVTDTIGWTPFLDAVPVRNHAATEEPEQGDFLPVSVRVDRPWWLVPPISWVLPVRTRRTIKLDGIGRFVWQWCDGKRPVETLVEEVADREELSFHEARIAVTRFLEELVRRGLIVLVVNEPGRTG
jgi:hypothetical protein